MKLLATGDLHLGCGSRLGPDRLEQQEENWQTILGIAQAREVDAVLLAGDVFHKRQPSTEEQLAFERPLVEYGGPVIAIPGNHDSATASGSHALDVFDEGGMLILHERPGITHLGDVAVVCLPWVSVARLVAAENGGDRDAIYRDAADFLLRAAADLRADTIGPSVLMLHYSVSGTALPNGLPVDSLREVVLPVEGLDELGFDAIIGGHIHKPQPFGANGLYVGSPMPLSFGEPGEHGCWILDVEQGGAEFIPLDSRPFLTFDYDVTDLDNHGVLEEILHGEFLTADEVSGAYVKLRFTLTEEHARRIDNTALRQVLLNAGAWNAWVEPTIVRDARVRVEGLDDTLTDQEAFAMWVDANVDEDRRRDMLDAGARYLEGAAA